MNKSHLTAMSRKSVSAPMRYLANNKLIKGKSLDFGCGRGLDADTFGMAKYDPYYFKCDDFAPSEFDTITCNFVLNTIPDASERQKVLDTIEHWLAPCGNAFISIRSDKKDLKGITKRGTYQGYHPPALPLLHKGSGYEIYHLKKV